MNRKYVTYAVLILAGVVLANRIRSVPMLDKLPSI